MTTAAPATLERAAGKQADKSAAEAAAKRRAEIARLEKQFVNVEAIRAWAKLQPVPLVLDTNGNPPENGFEVDAAMLARFNDEMVAAMQDKAGAEFEGRVRQGKVHDGQTTFVLT